jgi:hypothetical protein
VILVNINNLLRDCAEGVYKCIQSWMSVLIHELGHIWCLVFRDELCDDTTTEFVHGITDVAGKVSYRVITSSDKFKALIDDMYHEYSNIGWR